MTPTGNYNWCCGGGGGVQAIGRAADLRHKVFKIKMEQVEETGAETMVSACSNCRLTMDESKDSLEMGRRAGKPGRACRRSSGRRRGDDRKGLRLTPKPSEHRRQQ